MLKRHLTKTERQNKRARRHLRRVIAIYMTARNSLNAQAVRHGRQRR